MQEDNSNNLWVGTNKGISKINLKTDEITNFECDENGNVLSIWWNEGTCHLMGYDYDKEHFQTLPPFTHLHDKIQQLR